MYDINSLEFNKVLNSVSNYAFLPVIKERINSLTPLKSIDDLNLDLSRVEQAIDSIVKIGNLPLDFIKDVSSSLKRSKVGSILKS